jgi:hypothetical protein
MWELIFRGCVHLSSIGALRGRGGSRNGLGSRDEDFELSPTFKPGDFWTFRDKRFGVSGSGFNLK